MSCRLDRAPALIDIVLIGARQATDHRAVGGADLLRDRIDRLPIAGRGGWEASFDDINLEPGQLARDLQLLVLGHCTAGCLLAIAQSRVEDTYVIGYVRIHVA